MATTNILPPRVALTDPKTGLISRDWWRFFYDPTFNSISSATPLGVKSGGTGLSSGTSGGTLYFDSTTSMKSSALLTANALVMGGGAGGAPATPVGLGTNITVLHGNGAGAPTWGSVVLTSDVSGILPVANGGTGLASGTNGGILGYTATGMLASSSLLTANALVMGGGAGVTPSTPLGLGTTTTVLHGNAAGAPTWGAVSLTTDISGILPVANGGTGLASGTSGGVLAYTASGTLASSAALTAGALVFGGGAGAVPAVDGANLSWDNTNKRLAIGGATSTRAFNLKGAFYQNDGSATGTTLMNNFVTDVSGGLGPFIPIDYSQGNGNTASTGATWLSLAVNSGFPLGNVFLGSNSTDGTAGSAVINGASLGGFFAGGDVGTGHFFSGTTIAGNGAPLLGFYVDGTVAAGNVPISTQLKDTIGNVILKVGATANTLGFFGATPVVKQAAATELGLALSNYGLRLPGTANISGNAATVTTNANLTGPITSVGNATSIASQTGTGTKFVVDTSPTLITPNIGAATATTVNKWTLTTPATGATLTAGTDGATITFQGTDTYVGRITTDTGANRLKNKDLEVSTLNLVDPTDTTKKLAFTTSGNTTGINGTIAAAFTTAKTLTLPDATDTLIAKATIDTLTNKTYDTAGAGNSFKINGTAITAVTGTGSVMLAASPTTTGTLTGAVSNWSGTLTISAASAGGDVKELINNTDAGASSRATLQLQTGASANVWQLFARNNGLFMGVANVADYFNLTSTGINSTAIGATTASTIAGTTGTFNSTLAVTGNTTLTGNLLFNANGTVSIGSANNGIKSIYADYTNTATVGNVTINKPSGTVNIGALGNSITVTNSLATANSHIMATLASDPGAALSVWTIGAAGSFTINTRPAVVNQTAVDFFIVNAD